MPRAPHNGYLQKTLPLDRIAFLLATAHEDEGARTELMKMKEKLARLPTRTRASGLWPDIGSPDNRMAIRAMRSLHAPLMLRNSTRLLTHQLTNRIYMAPGTEYNGVLLIHDTGAGKTRTAASIAEEHAHTMHNRACVIGSAGLRVQFRAEIAQSAGAKFQDGYWQLPPEAGQVYAAAARRVRNPVRSALISALDGVVASRYQFFGYLEFLNAWGRVHESERVNEFSDRVIIIDEVHNLRAKGVGATDAKDVTNIIMHIAKHAFNTKFVLMSATPMFDRAHEIVDLLNILRINDDREPLVSTVIFPSESEVNVEALREGARGYVSTYRRMVPDSDIPLQLDVRQAKLNGVRTSWPKFRRDGSKAPGEPTVMIHVPASRLQVAYSRKKKPLVNTIEATNIVYPNEEVGAPGLASVLNANSKQFVQGKDHVFKPDHIAEMSPKIASLVSGLGDCQGLAMVYTNFLASGISPIAACLECAGYRPFGGAKQALTLFGSKNHNQHAPVYAIMSEGVDLSEVLRAVRLPSNADGSVIKVLLCTSVVAEGVDLAHVREVHLLEGWWNTSMEAQIIGRAVRFRSHIALQQKFRNVTVFRYGVVMPGDKEGMDHEMARHAASKGDLIRTVLEALHAESFDCLVLKKDAERHLAQLRTQGSKSDQSQGAMVTSRGRAIPAVLYDWSALESNLAKLCDGETLEISQSGHVGPDAISDLVSDARESMRDVLVPGRVYTLGDLLEVTGHPDDIGAIAIGEIVSHGYVVRPGDHDSNTAPASIVQVGNDQYTLSIDESQKHTIVSIPLVLASLDQMASVDLSQRVIQLSAALGPWEPNLDQSLVFDMAVDRAIEAGVDLASIRSQPGGASSIDRANLTLQEQERRDGDTGAKIRGDNLVFKTRRGFVCSHMARATIASTLLSMSAPVPPTEAPRAVACLLAEYYLRKVHAVERPPQVTASVTSKNGKDDGKDNDNEPSVDQPIGTADQSNNLRSRRVGTVVDKARKERRKPARKR